ncbi:MAG TPA: RNA-binding protein [Candidatus Syntrophoarchaeum butanivorans]|uniref:Exosome complex component Csl4 n=1 Tax=Candidatus Syntropharchaeum butanivorans TaxID=1839936 RepID=A0A7C1AVV6_9EURY|nr:MAG: RNA-binding protein [Candidatus Syntrophoarchaeum sp. WYZ-LMO15]HDM36668.1 RNA-binding protein [Candidatus Syntrophoarchaeum butanivorans]
MGEEDVSVGVVGMAEESEFEGDKEDNQRRGTRTVLPGDLIGISEEYTTGEGAYDEKGNIYATVVGTVVEDRKRRVIGVKPLGTAPTVIKRGDVVYGTVSAVKNSIVLVDLAFIEGQEKRGIPGEAQAAIHISNVKKSYVSELKNEFGYYDIVKGRVIDPVTLRLDTTDPRHGVIKAFCPKCKVGMRRKNRVLECPQCKRIESRKISTEYGKGLL